MPVLSLIARIIPQAKDPRKPCIAKRNGTLVEKYARPWTIFYSKRLNNGWSKPAIIPRSIASIGLKIKGALVPIIAAPAKTPYIKSFILILAWITADNAKEVTTHADIAQYAEIIPFYAKNGAVFVTALGPTFGTSQNMHG